MNFFSTKRELTERENPVQFLLLLT